ncbi:hypothetical protein Tco_0930817, partial [Tanacetum coccineum]
SSAVRTRDQDDPHDDAHPEGENSAKRQKTSEYEAYVSRESSSGQVNVEEPGPSTSGNQEQDDEFDFWTDSYASDDDEIPTKQVTQDIMEEISLTIDEAKLKKMADEMLRQRCTSGDEHQYHIDQMKNFLQSDIVWESRKEILVSPHPRKITPLVQSCQRDPEAPALSLINQDLLYLKKGNSGPEKIVLSLHKFPAIVFNDDDIEERTSRWVNKCIKKFNPYARYGVENWKNPHAKIFYIRRQKEPGRPKEEIYSNSKIVQVIKTYWELGHEHKFITEIVARRANDCIVPDYANTGLLWSLSVFIRSSVIWERVHDFQLGIESYQQKINLTAPTITFPGIEEYDVFSIVYEPVHGIIYTNSKKEKRVMRHSEIHKFCDATLRRTLEGLKSYNNDVKYGYVQKELTNDEVEFLKLFEEEIEGPASVLTFVSVFIGVSYSYELRGPKRQAYKCLENDEPRNSFSTDKGYLQMVKKKDTPHVPVSRSANISIMRSSGGPEEVSPTDGPATDLKLTEVVFPSAKDIVEFKPQLMIEPFAYPKVMMLRYLQLPDYADCLETAVKREISKHSLSTISHQIAGLQSPL